MELTKKMCNDHLSETLIELTRTLIKHLFDVQVDEDHSDKEWTCSIKGLLS